MKFQDLYNKVFVAEQDKNTVEVADPNDFNDVDPLPLPEPSIDEPAAAAVSGTTLTDYIAQLEEFANKLNSTDGGSLQALVSSLDKKDTPFEGIYTRTSLDILNTAKTLREIAETLKNFIIHASKK